MKRTVALILACMLLLSLLGCGNGQSNGAKQKDDGVLRVLLIGHSLGNDAMWMLPEVFKNEAPDAKVVLGFLYYSGCPLATHVRHAQLNMPVYGYLEFDSREDTYWRIAESDGKMRHYVHGGNVSGQDPESGISQTLLYAVGRQDWDVVVLQGYPWEVAKVKSTAYDPNLVGNANTLKQYVLDNDVDKETTPKFGWNMVWTVPDDNELIRYNDRQTMDANFKTVEAYYDVSAAIVRDELMPEVGFDYVMPSSTAFINALSGYKTTKQMYRDYIHASEFGRVMTAYLWYCTLTGAQIRQCKLDPIDYNYRNEEEPYLQQEDLVLTEEEKQTLVEVVGNALAKPYEITPKA